METSLPFISCICLTAGRVAQLSEAIACFQRQTYAGESELVIVNTLPDQQLLCDVPDVSVYNLTERPKSLGEARNYAIALAKGDACVIWDDDDLYLPNHLNNFGKHLQKHDWAWLSSQFYMLSGKIQKVVRGSANVVAFRKSAWETVGRYDSRLSVGEDRKFVAALTSKTPGVKVELLPAEISFIYAWGQGVYHISGMGDDKVLGNAWARSGNEIKRKVKRGEIKTGSITIKPEWKHDYALLAEMFTSGHKRAEGQTKSVGVVLLGRYGDICSALPMLKLIADRYEKPHLVIAREFLSLLDGVSYVEPFPMDVDNSRLDEAMKLANKTFKVVVKAQIWGHGHTPKKLAEAYNVESWQQAGFGHLFADESLYPVFDRRDAVREAALYGKLNPSGLPMLLVQVKDSVSSPFKFGAALHHAIYERWGQEFHIVDLSTVRAERIYDVIGLLEHAKALVCIDSAFIHFAGATGVPVVALVNPLPWLGSVPRANCVARITYTDAEANPSLVNDMIAKAVRLPARSLPASPLQLPPTRRLFHAVEATGKGADKRVQTAQASWDALYDRGVVPCHCFEVSRTAKAIGDKRDLPPLREVLSFALDQMCDEDILMWTNSDNWLHPNIYDYLLFHVSVYGPCMAQRIDFPQHIPPRQPVETLAKSGRRHMGRDLFAATKQWLVSKWDQIGDPYLGASDFDLHLAALVRLEYGIETTRKNIEQVIHPAEIPLGYVCHQSHKSAWSHPKNVDAAPSQKHNRKNFKTWAAQYLPTLQFKPGDVI